MKKTFLLKTMLLLCALVVGGNAWATTRVLTFDFTSTLDDWPTSNSTTLTNYTYTLGNVDYTFALNNVKKNSGYLMLTSTAVLGLPAIEGFKLTTVKASNSSGCSTSTRVGVSSSSSSASYVDGGNYQTWSTQSSTYTYNLTSTEENTMYYLYVTNKNAQVIGLELTYEDAVPTPTLSVDFESVLTSYTDWEFTNIVIHNSGITAHGGSMWGANVNSSGNGVSSASIQTKNPVAHPGTLYCYISKESTNDKTSTWKIQIKNNTSTEWTDVASKSASGMNKGEWQLFSANLSAYSNVFVRLYYDGNTAIRAIDDIVLTKRDITSITDAGWATWNALVPVSFPNDINAYIVSPATNDDEVTLTRVTSVPANTPVLLQGDAGTYSMNIVESSTTNVSSNCLHVSDGTAASTTTDPIYVLSKPTGEEVGFYKWAVGTTLPAGKIYLQLSSDVRSFIALPGEETGISATLMNNEQRINNNVYDLQGRPVAQPTKGLYIVNGKKVIIK